MVDSVLQMVVSLISILLIYTHTCDGVDAVWQLFHFRYSGYVVLHYGRWVKTSNCFASHGLARLREFCSVVEGYL